ncbi:MAG: redox-regulated ATPase YchF [Patescibacteria group bacterium]
MSLSIGIVGLPNVGKSTLFNALTKKGVEASNYPFCTIDPNVGIVQVPDERLDKIAAISQPAKIIPAVIEFTDIAGLVKGASEGEGLGNKFLSHIRECDAICEVVRNFEDPNIIHVDGKINPQSDRETINLELILADLQTVTNRLDRMSKDAKRGDKDAIKNEIVLTKIKATLENGQAARTLSFEDEEEKFVKTLHLLSIKPIIYLLNINDTNREIDTSKWDGLVIKLNAQVESEIANLEPADQQEFLQELGLEKSGLDKLVQTSYSLLDLISFFTTGKDETRAWTIKRGTKAPQAAGVIHTDFEKNFIKADVISWNKFVEVSSEAEAREKGLIRLEGKEYIMQDGDICNFKVGC